MVLIPKSDGATHPKDFRPISVGSIIIRLFSGILNRRIARISTNEAQRGFKSGVEGVEELISKLTPASARPLKFSARDHTYYIAMDPIIKLNETRIPNMNSDGAYKYLGINVKANGKRLCRMRERDQQHK